MQERVQRFGGNLAAMVIPNIGAFIAWGLITAFFIPTGWTPNADLAKLVGPMITYLLPLLIGYTGGKLVYGHRGGVVGAIVTAGIIIGSSVPMFLGAMIVGPLGAWLIKQFDRATEGKIPSGFEMLTNNFSAGILGAILAVLGLVVIGPVLDAFSTALGNFVHALINAGVLPLADIPIEVAKVLFLNNAINHGVLDRVVQEENLGDLDRDVRQRQHACVDQRVHEVPECGRERVEHRPDHDETEHGKDRPEDAGGEVVREHLEAGRDLSFGGAVELLDEPGAERPDDHRAEEHGNARPDDDAGGHDRSDNAAAVPIDELPTGVPDEEREQIRDHRPDELREVLVRGPPRWNEERGDESPRDERADVRDDHCGQVAAKALNSFLHRCPPPLMRNGRHHRSGRREPQVPICREGVVTIRLAPISAPVLPGIAPAGASPSPGGGDSPRRIPRRPADRPAGRCSRRGPRKI